MSRVKRYCGPAPGPDSEESEYQDPCLGDPKYEAYAGPPFPEDPEYPRSDEPSIESASTIPTPSTPDSSNDLVTNEKVCVLDALGDRRPFSARRRGKDPSSSSAAAAAEAGLVECLDDEAVLARELAEVFCRNGLPVTRGYVAGNPSKKVLFDLRDKLQTDIENMHLQLPAKRKEYKLFNSSPGHWTNSDVSSLVKMAREGRRILGIPPDASSNSAARRLDQVRQAAEKARLLVEREQRLSNRWRAFASRVKVLERRPQVNVDVESSLLRKRLCFSQDQFAAMHASRVQADMFLHTMLGSLRDSGAMEVIVNDLLEKRRPACCLPTLPMLLYWLTSYVTVLADGSIALPCNPPKPHGHPVDLMAQVIQMVKGIGSDAFSDLAKLRRASLELVHSLVDSGCKPSPSLTSC